MGYQSTVLCDNFYTKKTVEECMEILSKFIQERPELFPSFDMLEDVQFKLYTPQDKILEREGCNYINMDFSNETSKWEYDSEYALAILVSILMEPTKSVGGRDDYCEIFMRGEDNEEWGWRVYPMKVIPLEKQWKLLEDKAVTLTKEDIVAMLI